MVVLALLIVVLGVARFLAWREDQIARSEAIAAADWRAEHQGYPMVVYWSRTGGYEVKTKDSEPPFRKSKVRVVYRREGNPDRVRPTRRI